MASELPKTNARKTDDGEPFLEGTGELHGEY